MKRLSIRQYVSWVTLFPLIVLAICLELFFLHDRFSDIDRDLTERSQFVARQLASGSEYGVFSNNRVYLQGIAQAAMRQPDVRAVTILNASSEIMYEEGDHSRAPSASQSRAADTSQAQLSWEMSEYARSEHPGSAIKSAAIRSNSDYLWVHQPINAAQLVLGEPNVEPSVQQVGEIILEVSRARTQSLKTKMLWSTVTATAIFLVLILYLVHLVSRKITYPVSLLSDAAQKIGQGDLETRVAGSSRIAELGILMGGINEMAAKLQQENANLQQLVDERTAQAVQAMHIAETAQREAERANTAKSKFLAAASHDLRQPIHAQGLFLDVLSRTGLSAYQHELLSSARAASEASGAMLNTLLDFSRIEAGVVKPQVRAFLLQPLLNKIENEFAPQADEKGLVYRTRETPLAVQSDPMLVELILRNLVANAIRYTERGGVLVGTRRHGNQAVLEVWDTGIGIEAANQQEVFREFHQLGNPERDSRKGLGLGLAISEGLARTLNHGLSLVSTPQRGSVFRLTMPIATAALSDKGNDKDAARGNTGILNLRVLVIDDDEAVRAAMLHLLRNWGCECMAVESIEEALATARLHAPDVVISDYRLREQRTGAEAIAALRALLGNAIPALLVTGDTAPERLREAQASGIPLLHKPLSPGDLYRCLMEVLEGTSHPCRVGVIQTGVVA